MDAVQRLNGSGVRLTAEPSGEAITRVIRYSPLPRTRTFGYRGPVLISDVHEWINEIPTVPNDHLTNPQPRERAWQNQRGKKTLLSFEEE